jgi:uncharacterized protein (TIGR00299 family) protein
MTLKADYVMTTAYLDCFSGISGDMFMGALLDAGLSIEEFEARIRTLPLEGYSLHRSRAQKMGLSGTTFTVKMEQKQHVHRHLDDISEIIEKSGLEREVKERSIDLFRTLAAVEGRAHDMPPEKVHFHEVGAVDSIIDIVGAVCGLKMLGIDRMFASAIPLGSGFVDCEHGRIPLPAPATVELLKGVPVYASGLPFELVTPTGALIVRRLTLSQGLMPPMVVERTGYGAGARDLPDRPNLLRVLIGQKEGPGKRDTVLILEANIDDALPEWLGHLMERLFEKGALDVVFVPVQMKKNRPAVQVQVIANPESGEVLTGVLFREGATLGVRSRFCTREILERNLEVIESPWGPIEVKKVIQRDGSSTFQPEYEACRKIAQKAELPLREIFYWVLGQN